MADKGENMNKLFEDYNDSFGEHQGILNRISSLKCLIL